MLEKHIFFCCGGGLNFTYFFLNFHVTDPWGKMKPPIFDLRIFFGNGLGFTNRCQLVNLLGEVGRQGPCWKSGGVEPKNRGFFPPKKIHLFIGFGTMKFSPSIHFGGKIKSPYFWKHPY